MQPASTVMVRVDRRERERIDSIKRYLSHIRSRGVASSDVVSEAIDTYIAANPDIAAGAGIAEAVQP